MKHKNTTTSPVFVKTTDLHDARIQTLDETNLAFVCGGNGYLPTKGVKLRIYDWKGQLLKTLWGILGLEPHQYSTWDFCPVQLLTNVLLTAGLVTTTALITKKITNSDKNNPKTTKK